MDAARRILGHHSEAVDPTLVEWIKHQIDEVLGLDGVVIVAILGFVIVVFPLALMFLVWRQKRRASSAGRGER